MVQLSKRFLNGKNTDKQNAADSHKINDMIKSAFIRLIDKDGVQLGIFSRLDALYKARLSKLDLVEVSSLSKPPVCKLMDYGKFKYQQKRKVSKAKKGQSALNIKEIKFRPKTEPHDFIFKANNIKKFLLQGRKVKVVVVFKGREIIHTDIGKQMLKKIISEVKDYIILENTSKMEGKQLIAILSPITSKVDIS
jgi:translation initiation factor IF-3